MRFENVGTELVRIGINNKMGSTSIKAINGLKNFRTFDEDKVTVVLLRDAFSKFKSGYLQELNGFFTFEPPPLTNYLLNSESIDEEISISDNSVEDILQNLHGGRAPSKSKQMFGLTTNPNIVEFWSRVSRGYYKTFTLDDEVTRDGLEIMSKLHGIDRNIGWIYYNHGIFWKWNTINNISLFELGQYSNVYFLELEDLSNLKFLKWLQEKDRLFENVEEDFIGQFGDKLSNSNISKTLDLFWEKYDDKTNFLGNYKLVRPDLSTSISHSAKFDDNNNRFFYQYKIALEIQNMINHIKNNNPRFLNFK